MGVLLEPVQLLAERYTWTKTTSYHLGMFRGASIIVSYLVLGEFSCVQVVVTVQLMNAPACRSIYIFCRDAVSFLISQARTDVRPALFSRHQRNIQEGLCQCFDIVIIGSASLLIVTLLSVVCVILTKKMARGAPYPGM